MRGLAVLVSILIVSLTLVVWDLKSTKRADEGSASTTATLYAEAPDTASATDGVGASSASAPTDISAHNLLLRKGPNLRVYVPWLRGQMVRTRRNVNPSFDDPESFFLDVKTGVIR